MDSGIAFAIGIRFCRSTLVLSGAIYIDYKAPVDGGYYVLFNTSTAYTEVPTAFLSIPSIRNRPGQYHNYYFNYQSYELKSLAGFSELYWKMTDRLKWTLGLRYTDDKKSAVNYPIEVVAPGQGFPASGIMCSWKLRSSKNPRAVSVFGLARDGSKFNLR